MYLSSYEENKKSSVPMISTQYLMALDIYVVFSVVAVIVLVAVLVVLDRSVVFAMVVVVSAVL